MKRNISKVSNSEEQNTKKIKDPIFQKALQEIKDFNSQEILVEGIGLNEENEEDPFMGCEDEEHLNQNDEQVFSLEDTQDSMTSGLNLIEDWYSLPQECKEIFQNKGVTDLYDWQKEVLSIEEVQKGKNLVYSLPTSGGKTLVAEIILLKTLIQKKKALFILPYISLVEEKKRNLQIFGDELGFHVEPFYGSHGNLPLVKEIPILCISTIEKANSIINSLVIENSFQDLGCIVIDEL